MFMLEGKVNYQRYHKFRFQYFFNRYNGTVFNIAARLIHHNSILSCSCSDGGEVIDCTELNFEILTISDGNYEWKATSRGETRLCGIETEFEWGIGKIAPDRNTTIGKINRDNGDLYAVYNDTEHAFSSYEYLRTKYC